jgi:hypothetical protein
MQKLTNAELNSLLEVLDNEIESVNKAISTVEKPFKVLLNNHLTNLETAKEKFEEEKKIREGI